MTYRPYPVYKDSGIPWLGQIPEHWEVLSVRRTILDGSKGIKIGPFGSSLKLEIMQESGYKVYGQENIISGDFSRGNRYISDEKYKELEVYSIDEGDILITMMGSSGFSKVFPLNAKKGIMDSHLLKLRVNEQTIIPKYLSLLIDRADYIKHQVSVMGKGSIMHGLNSAIVKEIILFVPTLNEQEIISSFLDRETGRIDALVAKKERQIELLREKRAALISRAVTKGLDPAVPLKDSGIEWLGKIPKHWEICQLRYLLLPKSNAIKTGPFGSQLLSSEMTQGPIKVYNQRNIINCDFKSGDEYITREKHKELMAFTIEAGDILITTRGTIGRCAIYPKDAEPGILHPCLMRIQVNPKKVISEYLILLLQYSFLVQVQLFLQSNATTIDVIYSDNLKNVTIPLPPLEEQKKVKLFINNETKKIDRLVEKIQDSINLLKEKRSALISAAVTGKIDVRKEQLKD